jgi:hypothetical protein
MQNYHAVHGTLPPAAVCDKTGRPLLSWRVLMLPYLEEQGLYEQFKMDEPWDSAHNIELLSRIPHIYRPFNGKKTPEPYTTYYQVFVGKGAAFEINRGFDTGKDFPDGTSNTFLMIEGKHAVPWTKPEDLPYAAKQPLPEIGGVFTAGFTAALADGHVRFFLAKETNPATIRAFITRNGGETIHEPTAP